MADFAQAVDLAAWLDKDVQTDRANVAVLAATELIRDHCGWHIAPEQTVTLTLDGNSAGVLALPTLRLVDVVSVTVGGVLYEPTVYQWSAVGFLRVYGGYDLRSVEVEITHGYDGVPDIVSSVCLTVAARAYVSPEGYVQERFGGSGVTPSQSSPNVAGGFVLLPHEKAALYRYTIPAMP